MKSDKMNNEKPLVSVIIPTYNYGRYVSQAVDSALAQTYKNIEVIVVDDGSTDTTRDVLKKYQGRINYIYKNNAGLSAARNTGIQSARGEYVAFLDSDDQWLADKLEHQVKAFGNSTNVGIVSCGGYHVNDKGQLVDKSEYGNGKPGKKFFESLVKKNVVSGGSCAVVRKDLFDKAGFFDETLTSSEDWDMWLRISRLADICVLDKFLVNIRVGSDNMSSVKNANRMLENEIKVLNKAKKEDKRISSRLFSRALSYRYFCASWAYWKGHDHQKALEYILKSFFQSPLSFLSKKEGGLMARIILEKVLRFHIPVNGLTKPAFDVLYQLHTALREVFILTLKFFYFEPLFRSQCREIGYGLWMEQLPYIVGKGEIVIGNSVRLSGKPNFTFSNKVYKNPVVEIGSHTFIGHAVRFACAKRITVGEHCYIAGGVTIADNDGHPLDAEERRKNLPPSKESVKDVAIGNDVWIGRDAVILKGITIGSRSIIGSCAVVTKDVEEDSIVGGNPAQVIKKLKD